MEGASSIVLTLADGYVRKTTKRSVRKSKTKRHSILTQYEYHKKLYDYLQKKYDSPFLTPHPRLPSDSTPHCYEMESVDVSKFISVELSLLHELEMEIGFQFWDCEFYQQSNGKIAILDFDQVKDL